MVDITNRVAGVATLTVDGASYALRGNFGYRVATVERTSIIGQDGIHGYKEMPAAGQVKAQLTNTGGLSVAQLNQMTNVTIVAELANGKIITGRRMWTTGTQEVDGSEATVDVVWEGPDVVELAAA